MSERSYVCDLCNFSDKKSSGLKRHKQTKKHQNKELSNASQTREQISRTNILLHCDHCKQVFSKEEISQHIKTSIESLDFKRYNNILNVQYMYGTTVFTKEHIATPRFYKVAKNKIIKLLTIVLSGFPVIKFNIVLKTTYKRVLVIVDDKDKNSIPQQEQIFPFASFAFQASRHHYTQLKKDVSRALHQMIKREDDFVNMGKNKRLFFLFFYSIYHSQSLFHCR